MRYYDTVETPKTQKIFLEDGENRIPETDDRVKSWFTKNPDSSLYSRGFDNDGFPILVPIVETVDPVAEVWVTFEQEANAPATTTDPEGTWYGGESSAISIRGAALLAEDNNLTTAIITDVNREEHELTIEEIKKVSTAILLQWQAAFFKKQAALRELGQ